MLRPLLHTRIDLLPLLSQRERWVRRAVLVFMLWFVIPMILMTIQALNYY